MRNRDPIIRSCAVVDRDVVAEPLHTPYFALWVEDATYSDPLMDAWAQDVVRRLIDGLLTHLRGLVAALGRGMGGERAAAVKFGNPSYRGPTAAALFGSSAILQTKPKRPL